MLSFCKCLKFCCWVKSQKNLFIVFSFNLQGESSARQYTFSTLNILASSVLNLTDSSQYTLNLNSMYMATSAQIKATDLVVSADNIQVEEGSKIDLSEMAPPQSGSGS